MPICFNIDLPPAMRRYNQIVVDKIITEGLNNVLTGECIEKILSDDYPPKQRRALFNLMDRNSIISLESVLSIIRPNVSSNSIIKLRTSTLRGISQCLIFKT